MKTNLVGHQISQGCFNLWQLTTRNSQMEIRVFPVLDSLHQLHDLINLVALIQSVDYDVHLLEA